MGISMTSRGRWFLGAAFIFYMFGNQTQIGWLYVIAGLLVGLVITAGILNRGAARSIRVQRVITRGQDDESEKSPVLAQEGQPLHEGDPLRLTLLFNRESALPAVQVSATHLCPLADPDSEMAATTLYIPILSRESPLQYTLSFPVYRRGVYSFPPIEVSSAAPFGFFAQTRKLVQPDPQVIYPEYRPLVRLPLLDEQPAAEQTQPRAGWGSEVMGVRPYRPGDSPRHIHWPSVARTGVMMSKEFAQEAQPGVALVLDRHSPIWPISATKYTPFEMMVKAALSVGDYALRRQYTLSLKADETGMAHPQGPLTQEMLLEYLARVTPTEKPTLSTELRQPGFPPFVAVFIAHPTLDLVGDLVALHQRGGRLLVILADGETYPTGGLSAAPLAEALRQVNIAVRVIAHEDDWTDL
jgi:uncharacterized protein (DUF58 family)